MFAPRRKSGGGDGVWRNETAADRRQLLELLLMRMSGAAMARYVVSRAASPRALIAALAMLCLLLGSRPAAADIVLELKKSRNAWNAGTGGYGLYLGNDFTRAGHDRTNFVFKDIEMVIDENTGDVEISGTMRRRGGPRETRNWMIDCLNLENIEFKAPSGLYKNDGSPAFSADGRYDPSSNALTADMFADFMAGKNPFGSEDWSDLSGWGFEWEFLDMTLDLVDPTATSEISEYGWTGFAMPDMGHRFAAELHYNAQGGLTFEAWYKHIGARNSGGYYNTGDTKSRANFVGTIPITNNSVPEPSTFVLASAGVLSLMAISLGRRRRKFRGM